MRVQLIIKRIFDVVFSSLALIGLSPLLAIISIAIKIESDGEIIFKQNRLGRNGKTFDIYKFRTMIQNAENIGDGLSVKSENDNRITKVGQFLRKTSLDELPQLLNVIKGDMSLVGPRPPVTYHPYDGYNNYPDWARKRFLVRPGITGLAQVTVRNSVSWNERIKVDIKYIEEFSIFNDLKILFNTFTRVLNSKNVYS